MESGPVLVDLPEARPESGQSFVRISHAALNLRDLWIIKGQYAGLKYPVILGSDLSGYVDDRRVVANPGFTWGDNEAVQAKSFRILGLPDDGAFAESVCIPTEYLYDVPAHLTDAEASALPTAGITAYRALFTKCRPVPGERLLITGIGGGVALMVLKFAVAAGMEVFVTSSKDEKIKRAMELGAAGGVNYTLEDWDQRLLEASKGFHVIVDSAGGPGFAKLIKLSLGAGRICVYGGSMGAISDVKLQPVFWKQLSIYGTTMGTQSEFKSMLEFVSKHNIVPVVDQVFPFSDYHAAFSRLERRSQFGKIVFQVSL